MRFVGGKFPVNRRGPEAGLVAVNDNSARMQDWLRATLDPTGGSTAARAIRRIEITAVFIGLADYIIGTEPQVARPYGSALTALTIVISALFAIEWAIRLWLAPLDVPAFVIKDGMPHNEALSSPMLARLRWLYSGFGIIDLLAWLAIPLALACGLPAASARLLGVAWVLKLIRHTAALGLLGRVIRVERQPLLGVAVVFLISVIIASTLAYFAEHAKQPATFGSIPAAIWWAVTTLTTTGYGDAVPVTPAGRILGGIVMVCGIGMFALWAGILASGFSQELRRSEFLRTWDLVAQMPLFHSLGATTIADVTRLLRTQVLGRGRVVVRRGQPGDSMFFIADGEVEVFANPNPVPLGPGSFFGEMALISGEPRNATVVTTRSSTLLRLDVADFRQLMARSPELMRVIQAESARRAGRTATPPSPVA